MSLIVGQCFAPGDIRSVYQWYIHETLNIMEHVCMTANYMRQSVLDLSTSHVGANMLHKPLHAGKDGHTTPLAAPSVSRELNIYVPT